MIRPLTRKDYLKGILVGFLTMVLSLIATAVILVTILAISKRELAIGPLYLLIPVATFATGCYLSLRYSSRSRILNKPPSTVAVIAKSTAVGFTAAFISLILFFMWVWHRLPLPLDFNGTVGIDVHRLVYWPVMLAVFLAGFLSF
jgi:hypothetical protein